eukprot:TRINITY_DN3309_c0_g1_i6.p3 TRINITY_DN3309_c0_g1~~TRINITY_DN3309_c0_g1_i6.p3  ORF type:complete len:139 (+),score=50.27 TRINITY_DN3309_c0_g1_i6:92-508(+)
MCIRDRYQRRVHGEPKLFKKMKKSQPKKGILKKTHDNIEKAAELKWDEKGIAEYDKERGKCMKVSEPKTPYNEMTEEQKREYEQLGKELNSETVPYQQNGKIDLEALNSKLKQESQDCLLYTSPSPRDRQKSRMPSSA